MTHLVHVFSALSSTSEGGHQLVLQPLPAAGRLVPGRALTHLAPTMGFNTARWGQAELSKAHSTRQGLGVLGASFKEQGRRWPVSGDPTVGSHLPGLHSPLLCPSGTPPRLGDVGGWEPSCDTISEKGSNSVSLGSLTHKLGQ